MLWNKIIQLFLFGLCTGLMCVAHLNIMNAIWIIFPDRACVLFSSHFALAIAHLPRFWRFGLCIRFRVCKERTKSRIRIHTNNICVH